MSSEAYGKVGSDNVQAYMVWVSRYAFHLVMANLGTVLLSVARVPPNFPVITGPVIGHGYPGIKANLLEIFGEERGTRRSY